MAIIKQVIEKNYALYHGDCIDVINDMPDESIHFSVYSPPFCGLYHYSSSERDLSNCDSYEDFFNHYIYVVEGIHRITKPGRCTAVHCMDTPNGNSGKDSLTDFPGDIIRLHESVGFEFIGRHMIWKEPLTVRNRTMQHNLSHKTTVDDCIYAGVASADQLLMFRDKRLNEIPVAHPTGFDYYAGETEMPNDIHKYKGWKGKQTENRFSHWIWRNYASSFWYDIRLDNVLPYKHVRNEEDEKHVHPLQLDVIHRAITMRTNPGEVVFSPFGGVGSEPYEAVRLGRKAIAAELKDSYFPQMVQNVRSAEPYGEKELTLMDI